MTDGDGDGASGAPAGATAGAPDDTRDEIDDDEDHTRPRKEGAMLLARMAEATYWTGRYLERAECTARIIQVHADTHVDLPVGEDVGWEPLLAIAGVGDEFAARFDPAATPPHTLRPMAWGSAPFVADEADVVEFLALDSTNRSSILSSLTYARENLRTARPVIPREVWEACNDLWLESRDRRREVDSRAGRVQWLRRVLSGCQRINGILLSTMSRDEAMAFLSIGQHLERADLTTRVLHVRSDSLRTERGDDPYDVVHWMAVLRSLAAYQPFRRAMPARTQSGAALRFLLQDDRFPRAVAACLSETRALLKDLARTEGPLEACTNAAMLVAAAPIPRLALSGLDDFVDELQVALAEIHHRVDQAYFHPSLARWQEPAAS